MASRSASSRLCAVQLVVRDYDEAMAFYCGTLGFDLIEDTALPDEGKRWVTVRPPGGGTALVLGVPSMPEQGAFIGNQTGGRVAFFLAVDDFRAEYARLTDMGVRFVREPKVAPYGTVAVFADLYGNLWDLVEFVDGSPLATS